MPDGDISPVVPKREESREDNISSLDSPQEDDAHAETRESLSTRLGPDGSPILKRKGGRKPLYATTEERKQRNRRAQAAFRERRTEHIKQLETDIKHMQDTVKSLEQSQQRAKDECLMLRYKNSLLENLLLQKDVDFQKEISQSGMSYSPQQLPRNPVPLHRAVHQQRVRPSPINVGNRSPLVSGSQSVANASPVQPPMSAQFTFSPPHFPQQASAQANFGQPPRQPGQAASMSSSMSSPATRRPSTTQWNVGGGFPSDLDPNNSSFSLDTDALGQQNSSTALQAQQFQEMAASQHQFGMMGQAQFGATQPTISQVMEHGTQSQGNMGHQQGQQQTRPTQPEYSNMMSPDFSAFGMNDPDPFGINRSMQYPTQFDFQGTQRRQQ